MVGDALVGDYSLICKEESQQNRRAYIDALRVVAIFDVLLVHTDVASYYKNIQYN